MKKSVWVILIGVLLAILAQPAGLGITDMILLIAGDMSLDMYLALAGVFVFGLFLAGCLMVVVGVVSVVVRKAHRA